MLTNGSNIQAKGSSIQRALTLKTTNSVLSANSSSKSGNISQGCDEFYSYPLERVIRFGITGGVNHFEKVPLDTLYNRKNKELSFLHQKQSERKTSLGNAVENVQLSKLMGRAKMERTRPKGAGAEAALLFQEEFCSFDCIAPGVFLTGAVGIVEENCTANEIKLIVNATYEMPLINAKGLVSFRVPVEDQEDESTMGEYLEPVADMIEITRLNGGSSVVHCQAGVSRSTTLVLAYLVKYTSMTLKEAFIHTRGTRPVVRPNKTFWMDLISFESRITRGEASVTMVTVDRKNFTPLVVPDFYKSEFNELYMTELNHQRGNVHKCNIVKTSSPAAAKSRKLAPTSKINQKSIVKASSPGLRSKRITSKVSKATLSKKKHWLDKKHREQNKTKAVWQINFELQLSNRCCLFCCGCVLPKQYFDQRSPIFIALPNYSIKAILSVPGASPFRNLI